MDFSKAVSIVLKLEGGHSDDPQDPGGETNFGISKRSYPEVDITNLTEGHAKFLYERDFWMPLSPMAIPENCRLILFDAAVNHGVRRAIGIMQASLGLDQDCVIGPKTLKALENCDKDKLFMDIVEYRIRIYFRNVKFERFGRGWINRLSKIIYFSK